MDILRVLVIYYCIVDILCVLVINCVSYKSIGHVRVIYCVMTVMYCGYTTCIVLTIIYHNYHHWIININTSRTCWLNKYNISRTCWLNIVRLKTKIYFENAAVRVCADVQISLLFCRGRQLIPSCTRCSSRKCKCYR